MPFAKGQSGNPAGRPPKADKFAGQIAKAEGRIAKNLVRYIENMEILADGVLVQEEIIPGQPMVYRRPPDRQANEYLINRIMGKPTDRQEISGPDGGTIPLEVSRIDYRNGLTTATDGSASDPDAPGENESP